MARGTYSARGRPASRFGPASTCTPRALEGCSALQWYRSGHTGAPAPRGTQPVVCSLPLQLGALLSDCPQPVVRNCCCLAACLCGA